jgi:ubiquinone/menaquinone biosynthesis C-methylase UbiE
MTDEMLRNANVSKEVVARNLGFDNVRFMKGFLEEIPLADECVDLVTSNCVINLSAQKEMVFQEIFRI